jgi:uncharacterized protein (TIGR03000 family)
MFPKILLYGGLLLLAGAMILAAPGPVLAQHGGHSGGGHFGGAHFGGYHGGYYHGGYYPHYGYRHYYPAYGLGYASPYYGYAYPYYGDYYPYSYDTYPYAWPSTTYELAPYYTSYGAGTTSYLNSVSTVTPSSGNGQAYYPPATAQPDLSAHVTVSVPRGAQVWFDNTPTTSTGTVRAFYSPPLSPGKQYTYDVKASWMENGHEVTQNQKVGVTAGERVNLTFPTPSRTTAQASPASDI